MKIPWQQISTETLTNLIHERVTRDGTDYGECEFSLEEKSAQLLRQLRCEEAMILYDETLQCCEIVSTTDLEG